jgi:hypothetical protein
MCVHVKSMYVLCTAVKATVHLSLTVNLISLHTSAPKYYNRFVFRDRIIIIFKINLLPSYFYSPVECFLTRCLQFMLIVTLQRQEERRGDVCVSVCSLFNDACSVTQSI